jgi:signal transduction histidine kinase
MTYESSSSEDTLSSDYSYASSKKNKLLHSLSNKLLPIVVFSELALRRCEDGPLKQHLEKIRGAAEQARDILHEIRSLPPSHES